VGPLRLGRSRLALRLTLLLLAVTAVGVGVMGLVVTRALEARAVDAIETRLVTTARLVREDVAAALARAGGAHPAQTAAEQLATRSGTRVTIVAADGTVLGDSSRTAATVAALENHRDRPEVAAALGGRVGRDVRRSRTVGVDLLYVAVPVAGSGARPEPVLRLALPLTEVAQASAAIRRTVLGAGLVALGVVAAVGLLVGRRVTRPLREMREVARRLAEGDFERAAPAGGDDEVGELGRTLNLMARSLRDKIQTLEDERARVAAILDSMVEGVIAMDARGRILLANPGARAIFELAGEAVEGRPFLEVIRDKALLDLIGECRAAGPGGAARREVELPPPRSRILSAHAAAVAFAPQRLGVLLVLHDVTALRRLERVKTEFVANVSHELRTPLTAIRGYLETLRDGALDEPANARRFIQIAHRHAERLSRLVDDLLQLSNLETGKLVLDLASLPLVEVTAGAAAMFQDRAARAGLTFLDRVPPHLAVRADRDRLTQILVNLLDNAVKHTPAGGRIALDAAPLPDGGVEVSVADTGAGIPSTDLPRLTERFYRVDRARSRELGGTGLGLAIVKHLVQAHGGDLRIESQVGAGTTVRFSLPAG
jgi:two-component system phosphate regulon sensor histidine kinase PhoR